MSLRGAAVQHTYRPERTRPHPRADGSAAQISLTCPQRRKTLILGGALFGLIALADELMALLRRLAAGVVNRLLDLLAGWSKVSYFTIQKSSSVGPPACQILAGGRDAIPLLGLGEEFAGTTPVECGEP